jgi:hypothetical protein
MIGPLVRDHRPQNQKPSAGAAFFAPCFLAFLALFVPRPCEGLARCPYLLYWMINTPIQYGVEHEQTSFAPVNR